MEGESPLLKDGALSLQTSLSHRELPPRAPVCTWQRVVSLCTVRVLLGEVFCFGREVIFLKVRLSRLFCEWGAYGVCVFCKCRLIPPSSVADAPNCLQFSSPKGKPSARFLSYYVTKDEESIYTRPHPSPTVTPSPSKGKASVGSASYIESASSFNPSKIFFIKQVYSSKSKSK